MIAEVGTAGALLYTPRSRRAIGSAQPDQAQYQAGDVVGAGDRRRAALTLPSLSAVHTTSGASERQQAVQVPGGRRP